MFMENYLPLLLASYEIGLVWSCTHPLLVSRARQTNSVRRLWNPNPWEYSRVGYFSPFGCALIRLTVIFF